MVNVRLDDQQQIPTANPDAGEDWMCAIENEESEEVDTDLEE